MPSVSNYYASVGVGVDRGSLQKVRGLLTSIEKQFQSFQKRIQTTSNIRVGIKLDRVRGLSTLRRELSLLGKSSSITLSNIKFNTKNLTKSLQRSMSANTRQQLQLNAAISSASLKSMQQQVSAAINQMVVSPTINPRVSAASVRGAVGASRRTTRGRIAINPEREIERVNPFARRKFSPWYNPMQVGGGLGAFIRYGAYSLPFVAGAMGLNAITNRAETLQNIPMVLNANAGGVAGGRRAQQFLGDLGGRLGFTVADMAPSYARMLANSKGTSLEGKELEKGFTNFLEYASVSGLNRDEQNRAVYALQQMIGSGQVRATELIQMENAGLGIIRKVLAEEVAGGDSVKLKSMLSKGEVGEDAIKKMLDKLGALAQPWLSDLYKTIGAQRRRAQRSTEQWFEGFLGGNVNEALADFYKTWRQITEDATPHAEKLGHLFAGIVHYFRAIMLIPGEIGDWFKGSEDKNNIMNVLFGEDTGPKFLSKVRDTLSSLTAIVSVTVDNIRELVSSEDGQFSVVLDTINGIIGGLSVVLRLLAGFQKYGWEGLTYTNSLIVAEMEASSQADWEAEQQRNLGRNYPKVARDTRYRDLLEEKTKDLVEPTTLVEDRRAIGAAHMLDFLGPLSNELRDNLSDRYPEIFDSSNTPNSGGVRRAVSGGVITGDTIPTATPQNTIAQSNLPKNTLDNIILSQRNLPDSVVIRHVVSGEATLNVDGEILGLEVREMMDSSARDALSLSLGLANSNIATTGQ